jgi:hypothetical protein
MFWAATMRRVAYDPETISMLSSVLERAIAALPHQQRTEDGKAQLASSILAAAARGERDPIQLYATALAGGCLGTQHRRAAPPTSPPVSRRASAAGRERAKGVLEFSKPSRG